ncbi:hypothetical protein SAMN05421839_10245 [Halolactibacillus halophilus]|uniref:Uncharacterized protein n=1 Tax=Halolactibacillus halophilus TaxID=306540 RepID=A0A1I5LGZ3_9BACI|nr:hypothetical protein [Halolactibacillus halophilus]GEM00847.1 hypothetical protein HHA03_03790 [Halolactibacillus halophilus]SFO95981.1 hypothetical protein SAMN05421839_10245 [Halolactibacillus halophilus]
MRDQLILDAIILPLLLIVLKKNRFHLSHFKFDYLYEEWLEDLSSTIQTDLLVTKKMLYQQEKITVKKMQQTKKQVTYHIYSATKEKNLYFTPVELKSLTERYLCYYLFKGDDTDGQ